MGKRRNSSTVDAPVVGSRTIVCTVKNEAPFFLEWLAYHRLIGFDQFIIFSNDCSDGTDELLQALDGAGIIHHYDNNDTPKGRHPDPQVRAYGRASELDLVRSSEWIMVLDGDEFLQVKAGEGTLNDLLAALPKSADAIGIQWRIFGSSGVLHFTDDLQINMFRHAAPDDFVLSTNHLAIKTLFRPEKVRRLGIHRPVFNLDPSESEPNVLFLNGNGEDVTDHFYRGRWAATLQNAGYKLAQVNHYMIRSHEMFLMKRWRGTANSSDSDRIGMDYYSRFNSNHDRDDKMERWVTPVRKEISSLKKKIPALENCLLASTDFYSKKISELKENLQSADPDVYERLFDEAKVAAEIASQQEVLSNLRLKYPAEGCLRMMPLEYRARSERQVASVYLETHVGRTRGNTPLKDHEDDVRAHAGGSPAAAAPSWLQELRGKRASRGFYHSFAEHGLHYVDRGSDTLVVSFDNLSSVGENQVSRESWGYPFIQKQNWSHLGVFAYTRSWFRDDELISFLCKLADEGFFAKFKKVAMIGTSMGAYAATAFSSLAPGCVVVAFSPQSTLHASLVPWEKRFNSGRKADWSGRFADGAEEAKKAGQVWLIYDPLFKEDVRHADRYVGKNIIKLRARYAHHKTALFLRRAELLSTVVSEAIAGTMDEKRFYALYRRGRSLPWYLLGLGTRMGSSGQASRLEKYRDVLLSTGRTQLARSLEREYPDLISRR